MATSSDDGDRTGNRSDLTAVDRASPFDSAERSRETQLSDPPTAVVRTGAIVDLPPGSVVDEIYEIDAKLGSGAMGEVYAARHVKLGKRVAIKVIGPRLSEDAAAIERFAMEARTLAQIQHPAIVAVEHVGELADGRAYFVMEFLRGETLFDRLARGRVPLPEALRILDQMARAIEAAHDSGVTHRDLKPENTFLVHLPGEPPTVKLVDFGLAKLAADVADVAGVDRRAERTESGVAIGTPMYMSPEQMRGQGVDYRTDIYALGCIAYELVLGEPPFPRAQTAPELYAAHLHEDPPLPRAIWPEVPPQLDLALFAMLAKDPTHRPTLEQVRAVIAAARDAAAAQRAETEYVGTRATKVDRRLAVIAIAVVALVGGVTIGAALTTSSSSEKLVTPAATHEARIPAPAPAAPAAPVVPATPTAPVPDVRQADLPKPTRPILPARTAHRTEPPRPPPRAGSAAATVPVDEGAADPVVEAPKPPAPPPVQSPAAPIDRNQTVNPFAKKHKVNP